MKSVSVIALGLTLALGSCSSSTTTDSTDAATTIAPPVTVAVTVPMTVAFTVPATVSQTAVPLDACDSATQEANDAFAVVLDRVDADALSVAESELLRIFTDLGYSIGAACGETRLGEAYSTVILWLTSEAPTRSAAARGVISGVLSELCPGAEPFGLSVLAQVACSDLTTGNNNGGYGVGDFKDNAEEFIEGDDVAAQAGTTFSYASCASPEKIEVGETFSCTAIDTEGVTWEFDLVVTSASAYEITNGTPRG